MSTRRAGQRGLAAVEMAIVMPVFIMLLLGVAELGRACYQYNTLAKAVRQGARHLAERALTEAGTIAFADGDLAAARSLVVYGKPGGAGTPLVPGLGADHVTIAQIADDYVTVTVQYPYVPMLAAIPTFGYGDTGSVGTLSVAATMRAM